MRILLHGGHKHGLDNLFKDTLFFKKIINAAKECDSKVLLNFFSRERTDEYKKECINYLEKIDNSVIYEIANKENFQEQIENYKVIFFQGGSTQTLLDEMKKYDTSSLKNKKLIAGSSAGANYLSTYSVSSGGDAVLKCSGVLPYARLPHSNVWEHKKCIEILRTKSNLPLMLIPEDTHIELIVGDDI